MRWISILFITISSILQSEPLVDLEETCSDFVLKTIQIKIPEYPHAFNPSIIRWNNNLLLSFRVILDPKSPFESRLGLVWLNEDFQPKSTAQLLDTQKQNPTVPSRAEDGRLLTIGEKLYFIYSNCIHEKISRGGFRVHIGEISYDGKTFHLEEIEPLLYFQGEGPNLREKNWAPFDYEGNLFLAYSLSPHLILHPIKSTSSCQTICSTTSPLNWQWGTLRGGTAALLDGDEYLAFFHTSQKMSSIHSNGKEAFHYFMGAYRFTKEAPFSITHISQTPIIGKNFYKGNTYKPYWGSVQAIFPCGFLLDGPYIWVAYGRQDHECWIAKLDKEGLMKSLKEVD